MFASADEMTPAFKPVELQLQTNNAIQDLAQLSRARRNDTGVSVKLMLQLLQGGGN